MDGGLDRKDEPGIQHRREDGEDEGWCGWRMMGGWGIGQEGRTRDTTQEGRW